MLARAGGRGGASYVSHAFGNVFQLLNVLHINAEKAFNIYFVLLLTINNVPLSSLQHAPIFEHWLKLIQFKFLLCFLKRSEIFNL